MLKEKIYEQCVEKWGAASQLKHLVEECAELIVAIHHFDRGKATIDDIIDEIVDVEIMLQQTKIVYSIDERDYDKRYKQKLLRLAKLVWGNEVICHD